MALQYQTPPEKAVRSVNAALDAIQQHPVAAVRLSESERNLRYPLVVYHLGLDDVVAGKGLEAASAVSWAHLVGLTTDQMLVEVQYDSQEFLQLNQGPFGAGISNAIGRLENAAAVRAGNYQVNVLRVPGIYVVALWLKREDGSGDLMVPVAPVPPDLVANQSYSVAEFFAIVGRMAEQRLRFDNSPQAQ